MLLRYSLEETAPVKLPTRHCPQPGNGSFHVRTSNTKGGISRSVHATGVHTLQSSPTYPTHQGSMFGQAIVKVHGVFPSCRVHCIFTASSISLSLGWRQLGHHYAIRAGRNLPDKEFRYLRTVIVTAAVYRGFDQSFACADPIN